MPQTQLAMEAPLALEVQRFLDEVEAAKRDAQDLAAGLNEVQFNWRPAANRWSVGQCLAHLTLTVQLYLPSIEHMIDESRERTAQGRSSYRPGWLARWLIKSMEPPPGMKVKTMNVVDPPPGLDPHITVRQFIAVHDRLAELARSANEVDLNGARMTPPFMRIMRMTLGQSFAVNTAHARRHLWQARQVRRSPGFPTV